MSLFELDDFAPPTPAWAETCMYCHPDVTGYFDEEQHLKTHLALTCVVCGEVSPNRLLFEMSHNVSLGASWQHDALLCVSLSLRLNHLTYDAIHGEKPHPMDLTAVDLGWTIAPDGHQIAPAGWPDGSHATVCAAFAREDS